jgi:dTDP-4-amino-4,6-dideoxygalactose transaminase
VSTTRTAFLHPVINPTLPDPAEFLDELRAIFASGQVTLGKHVAALEADVCSRTGVANTVAMSSGTSGLMLLLRALRLPEGSEVITPSFTFAATSHALLWNNLVPVFCDSEPESFTMDAEKAESLVTERTSAIYPVCIFGVPGDIDAYQSIADRHGLHLLFDSAQGLGAGYKGRAVGNFGNGEVFSLSPTKVVTSLEGGLVTTNNDGLAEQLRSMRDYGKAPGGEDMVYRGLSARMTEINALVARWSLARAGTWIANRAAVMERYEERLSMIPGIMFQRIPTHCTSSRNYVVITLDPQVSRVSRDELYMWLKSQGIQTKRYFFPALHNQTLYRHIDPGCARRLPVAEYIAANAIALPMYSHMNLETVDEISDRIIECFERAGVYTE